MAWDSSRPVPWRRLIREWLIYVGIAGVALVVYYLARGKKLEVRLFAGLLSSGPMYLLFGGVLAKFGYQRKTMKDLRAERPLAAARSGAGSSGARGAGGASTTGSRSRPAPTKRTSTGPSQYRKNNKPKRR